MKIKEMLDELSQRDSYKQFKKKYPNSYFSTGFFMLGNGGDKFQFNFFLPDESKIVSFEYPFGSYVCYDEKIDSESIFNNFDLKVDIDNLQEYINKIMNKKISRIIALINNNVWNIICLNGLDMNRIKINALTGEVIDKNDGKLSDFIKINSNKD